MNKNKIIKSITKRKKVIIYFLILIAVIYLLYGIFNLIKEPTDIFMVENGKIYVEESTIGYVIREEIVVKGENYKNGIAQIKSEGQKVSKNEAIFRYYSNSEDKLIKKIEELDGKIQTALSSEDRLFTTSDMKILENHISQQLYDLYNMNDLQKISEYKQQINSDVIKKARIVGEFSPLGSYAKQLIEERSTYEAQLNSGSEKIVAPISGIVSYRVDGLESVLKPNDFSSLSKNLLEELKLKTGQIIPISTESGKIINNFNSYIAVCTKSENANDLQVGNKKIKLRLSNSVEIPTKICYISTETDGSKLIVFEINKSIAELISYRKISLDIIWSSAEGLKIPNTAILEEEGLNYVIRNRAGYLDKILVKVLKQNESYSIVTDYTSEDLEALGYTYEKIKSKKSISLYDEILIKPQHVNK